MLSAKIRTKWIIGRTKWIIEYFSYLALVEYRTKWIRIKWGPGVYIASHTNLLLSIVIGKPNKLYTQNSPKTFNDIMKVNQFDIVWSMSWVDTIPCWNPTICNIIHWFAGPMGQMTRRPSIWCSKYFFFHYF